MTDLFIGVDGGGSGCRVALADATGRVIGSGVSGPANALSDPSGSVASIAEALRTALTEAAIAPGGLTLTRAHAGLAGIVDAAIEHNIETRLAIACPGPVWSVSEDRETQTLGALGGRDGAVVAIGTGSFVARVADGAVRGIGGWGLILGDEASGAALGRAILSRALHVVDGLEHPSALTDTMLEEHGGPAGIVRFAATATPAAFAALAPRIVAGAEAGDAQAVAIMEAGSSYIERALASLGGTTHDTLCLAGGLGPAYARWLAPAHQAQLAPPVGSALDGALIRAGAPVAKMVATL